MSASSFAIIPEEFGLFLDHGVNCNQTFDYCGIQGECRNHMFYDVHVQVVLPVKES